MKKIISLLSLIALSLTLAACSQTTTTAATTAATTTAAEATTTTAAETTKTIDYNFVTAGKLTVAMSTDFAPYEFIDLTKTGQDKYVGSDVEFAKLVANYLGLALEIKAMDFDTTLVALDNGIADIAISGFSYTAERAASYTYTNCYFSDGDGGQVILINKADATKYTTVESMNVAGVKIAAQNGALQQDLVKQFTPNATLVAIDDLNSEYDALAAGSVDGIAIAENVAEAVVEANPDKFVIMAEAFDFNDSGSFALVKKGNTALCDAVNEAIKTMTENQYADWVEYYKGVFANLGDNAGEIIPEEE